jgi:hypothetical protein
VGCIGRCCADFRTSFLEAVYIPVLGSAAKIPMTNSKVIRCSDEMALFMGIPRKTVSVLKWTREIYPSRVCPTSRISGLHSLPLGEFGCFVRSKIRTSPLTDMVAIISGFCG